MKILKFIAKEELLLFAYFFMTLSFSSCRQNSPEVKNSQKLTPITSTSPQFKVAASGPITPLAHVCAKYTFTLTDELGNVVIAPEDIVITLDPNSNFVSTNDPNFCSDSLGTRITQITITQGTSAQSVYLVPGNENNTQLNMATSLPWLKTSIVSSAVTVNSSPPTSGSLDTSFTQVSYDGLVTGFDLEQGGDGAYSIAIQDDSKYIVGGRSNHSFALARYNTDSTLDSTFGTGGIVLTTLAKPYSSLQALKLQADGKILTAGYTGSQDYENDSNDIVLARYNSDGSLDTSFGTGGIVYTDISGYDDKANSLALQTNGYIVVAGKTKLSSGTNFRAALLRYDSDGNLDSSFGTAGIATHDLSGSAEGFNITAISLQQDGKIVATGYLDRAESLLAARFNTDGSLDANFATNGIFNYSNSGNTLFGSSILLQADDKIVIGGSVGDSASDSYKNFIIARLNSDGSADTAFGTNGIASYDVIGSGMGGYNFLNSLALTNDNKIVESTEGTSPSAAHGSERDSLPSFGSC